MDRYCNCSEIIYSPTFQAMTEVKTTQYEKSCAILSSRKQTNIWQYLKLLDNL